MRSASGNGAAAAPRVVLACPGLDHATRGFETFARECFEALHPREELRVELVKGSGDPEPAERVLPAVTRDAQVIQAIARAVRREPFVAEHVAFGVRLAPALIADPPDVVYFSEWHLGRVLAGLRRASRGRFALVMSNGSLVAGPYDHLDHVQQLAPGAIDYTVAAGQRREIQTELPLGVAIHHQPLQVDQDALRSRLDLPARRRIVLSAGALNHQKRIDYLIEEVASAPEPRPFLLLLGAEERETPALRALAQRRLGPDGHRMLTVPKTSMPDYYLASDAFVLASLWESFGRVLVEAQAHGLPCLAHDYPVMRWVLGAEGEVADLSRRGAVAGWLSALADSSSDSEARSRRHRSAYDRFSWDVLTPRYVEMLRSVVKR